MNYCQITYRKHQQIMQTFGTEQKHFTLKQNNQFNQYNARQNNNLLISRTNKLFIRKCIRHNIPITINSTPEYVQSFAKRIQELNIYQ